MFHTLGRHKKLVAATTTTTCSLALAFYYLNASSSEQQLPPLSSALQPNQSLQCPLVEKQQLTHDTALFRFGLPTPGHRLGLPLNATSHIVAHDNAMVSRAYTPTAERDGSFDLIVKHYPGGELSQMFHRLKIGDMMQFRGPIVTLPYHTHNSRSVVGMIAGGTGITPMYQLLQIALKNGEDETKFVLLYANRSNKDVLLKDELDSLSKQYPDRFRVHYVIEEEIPKTKRRQRESNVSMGKVHKALVEGMFPASTDAEVAILVCGPPGMMQFLCGSNSPQQRQLGGLLGSMGYSHQVFVFTDLGVKQFFPSSIR